MKVITLLLASLATVAAFAPAQNGRVQSVLSAEKKPFFSQIFDMDLFAPVATQNDYGARTKKNVSTPRLLIGLYVWDCQDILCFQPGSLGLYLCQGASHDYGKLCF
jgi:hypothetical protein